ncbi:MAG TPA: hypothetical protein VF221_07325, partial [Chloroflexota bacterium]
VMRTPSKTFRASYKQLGGAGVLGRPVTNALWVHGERVEFFEYGELLHAGANFVVPVGDAQLRLRGWLPATGAGDAYPSTMSRDSIAFLSPPRPPKHPAASRMTALRRHVLVERFASFLRARASRPKAARTSKTSSS